MKLEELDSAEFFNTVNAIVMQVILYILKKYSEMEEEALIDETRGILDIFSQFTISRMRIKNVLYDMKDIASYNITSVSDGSRTIWTFNEEVE